MPDQHIRTEGDYEIWASDGIEYKRYAKGNSLGKGYRGLAERHPRAYEKVREALSRNGDKGSNGEGKAISPSEFGEGMALLKKEKQTERKRLAQVEAEAGLLRAGMSLSPLSPKLPAEAWGFIVEKQAEAAMSPDLGHSVRAAEFVGRATEYLAVEKAGTHIDRMQVIVLDQDTAELLTQRGGLLLPDVVEGQVRELPAETDGASDGG